MKLTHKWLTLLLWVSMTVVITRGTTSHVQAIQQSVEATENSTISVSPPRYKTSVVTDQPISQLFELKFKNFTPTSLTINYKEFNPEYTSGKDSEFFKQIAKANATLKPDSAHIDTHIDTGKLANKTYFFGLEVIVNNNNNSFNILSKNGIVVPIIITSDQDSATRNPKPEFVIKPRHILNFSATEITIRTQTINQSDKQVIFGGEILVLDQSDMVIYSEKISSQNNLLNPRQILQKDIVINNLPRKGLFPYFGRLKLVVRGTVNNSRHIETKPIKIFIIPYQIIAAGVGTAVIVLLTLLGIKKRIQKRS